MLAAKRLQGAGQESREVARPHSQAHRQHQAGKPAPPAAGRVEGVVQRITEQ